MAWVFSVVYPNTFKLHINTLLYIKKSFGYFVLREGCGDYKEGVFGTVVMILKTVFLHTLLLLLLVPLLLVCICPIKI